MNFGIFGAKRAVHNRQVFVRGMSHAGIHLALHRLSRRQHDSGEPHVAQA